MQQQSPKKEFGTPFKKGNVPWNKGLKGVKQLKKEVPCACGCGQMLMNKSKWKRHRRYIYGHWHWDWDKNPIKELAHGRGENHSNWKGGTIPDCDEGYTKTLVGVRKYRKTHRVVMEQHVGRPLLSTELVHHKDGKKANNDISNLQLVTKPEHMKIHKELGAFKKKKKKED